LLCGGPPAGIEDYLRALKASGAMVLRLMLEYREGEEALL
jgi:hypothetical protein